MNAIEAVGTGGNVSCTLHPLPTQENNTIRWHWHIEDDGPGPPVELGRSITEAFVTSKPEGIGLGLAMAKRVAETSGGSLDWVRVNGKTAFHFRVMDKPGHG
jgi:signal transduction histidine kinase